MHKITAVALAALAVLASNASGLRGADADAFPKPGAIKPDEPVARELSLEKAGAALDSASVHWTAQRKCVTCHTNVPYLLARPAVKDGKTEGMDMVRKFFEDRVTSWEKTGKTGSAASVVATASALALNDARTTGKLHPLTRKALDRMWTMQKDHGAWNWDKCVWPPFEHDDYYGAVLAAVAVGQAPDGYAATEAARAGLDKLRGYLRKVEPPTLHHKLWLLWASLKMDGLMSAEERAATVKELIAARRADGGWSLGSLGDWKGFDGRANNKDAASDGYGTGLAVFILRQAGMLVEAREVQGGVAWLKANQRQSGRWFTPSLNNDRAHYISNAGTAFAVLALDAVKK